jgi:hypothetical protein
VAHGAHEDVVDQVVRVGAPDHAAVVEFDQFVSISSQCGRVHACIDGVTRPASHHVVLVWAVDVHVRNGRVVTRLLHVDLASILTVGLVGLSQDWIERLLEDLFEVEVSNCAGDYTLHSLHWIFGESSSIEHDGESRAHSWDHFQDRGICHALNGEAHLRQVEVPTQDFATSLLDQLSTGAAQLGCNSAVQQLESTIARGCWTAVVSRLCQRFPLLGKL